MAARLGERVRLRSALTPSRQLRAADGGLWLIRKVCESEASFSQLVEVFHPQQTDTAHRMPRAWRARRNSGEISAVVETDGRLVTERADAPNPVGRY